MNKPIIDLGTPPAALLAHQQLVAQLVEGGREALPERIEPPAAAEATREPFTASSTTSVTDASAARGPIRPTKPQRVELEYVPDTPNVPGFKLAFTVGEVCVREHYLSLWIVTDLGFKPSDTMRFNLTVNSITYPVVFAGAEFEFQSVGIRGISFLIEKKRRSDHAENRPSGAR